VLQNSALAEEGEYRSGLAGEISASVAHPQQHQITPRAASACISGQPGSGTVVHPCSVGCTVLQLPMHVSLRHFTLAGAAEYQTLLGMATPPTSYGGYGGNANEKPKYSFEYPTGWKTEVPSKVCMHPAMNPASTALSSCFDSA
jgi:hypothetical protein